MSTEVNPKIPIGQVSVDATLLAKRLEAVHVGDVITYGELTAVIGRDVQGHAYHILQSARSINLREFKIAFGTVVGVGLKRLSDEELADSHHAPIAHIRRTSSKAGRVMACADTSKLPPDKQRSVSTGLSVLGAISLFTARKNVKAVNDATKPSATPEKLDVQSIVALFAK